MLQYIISYYNILLYVQEREIGDYMKTTGKTYEVKYTGYLMNSENMFLHYGYDNWSDVSEKKMRKLKSCYKIEVTVPAETTELNFCFRAGENEWDNNSGNNWNWVPSKPEAYEYVEIADATKATKTASTTKAKATTSKAKTATKCATAKAKKQMYPQSYILNYIRLFFLQVKGEFYE